MRKVLLLIVLAMPLIATPAFAQHVEQTTTKRQDIERLLELSLSSQMLEQMHNAMMPQITQMIRQNHPTISQQNLELLLSEVNDLVEQSLPQFREAIIPLYEKRFTHDEIRDIIAFHKSPGRQEDDAGNARTVCRKRADRTDVE